MSFIHAAYNWLHWTYAIALQSLIKTGDIQVLECGVIKSYTCYNKSHHADTCKTEYMGPRADCMYIFLWDKALGYHKHTWPGEVTQEELDRCCVEPWLV